MVIETLKLVNYLYLQFAVLNFGRFTASCLSVVRICFAFSKQSPSFNFQIVSLLALVITLSLYFET
jgi:hypothetical protein